MHVKIIYFIIAIVLKVMCVGKKYTNYTLFQAVPVNDSHLDFFLKLQDNYNVNFWKDPSLLNFSIDFVIHPVDKPRFIKDCQNLGIHCSEIIGDVQRAFDKQIVKDGTREEKDLDWSNYYALDDIYKWLRQLSETYPQEVKLRTIGVTHEKRHIIAVHVVLPGCQMRSTVIIEGGIHAREWISPAFVTYFINAILHSQKSKDTNLKEIALTYEWYFVPVMNPDGYAYTFTKDRLWRKNRSFEDGVDLNRNFAHRHGSVGVSKNPRSEKYCGHKPFSERESNAMAKLVTAMSSTLEYYISFHSYGQQMIIPYLSSKKHLDNYYEVREMCRIAAKTIKNNFGTVYHFGTAYEITGYTISGASTCWVKEKFNVPYVLSFELRDKGLQGFALNPSEILPTCKETLDGVISLLTPRTAKLTKLQRKCGSAKCSKIDYSVIIAYVMLFIIMCIY